MPAAFVFWPTREPLFLPSEQQRREYLSFINTWLARRPGRAWTVWLQERVGGKLRVYAADDGSLRAPEPLQVVTAIAWWQARGNPDRYLRRAVETWRTELEGATPGFEVVAGPFWFGLEEAAVVYRYWRPAPGEVILPAPLHGKKFEPRDTLAFHWGAQVGVRASVIRTAQDITLAEHAARKLGRGHLEQFLQKATGAERAHAIRNLRACMFEQKIAFEIRRNPVNRLCGVQAGTYPTTNHPYADGWVLRGISYTQWDAKHTLNPHYVRRYERRETPVRVDIVPPFELSGRPYHGAVVRYGDPIRAVDALLERFATPGPYIPAKTELVTRSALAGGVLIGGGSLLHHLGAVRCGAMTPQDAAGAVASDTFTGAMAHALAIQAADAIDGWIKLPAWLLEGLAGLVGRGVFLLRELYREEIASLPAARVFEDRRPTWNPVVLGEDEWDPFED